RWKGRAGEGSQSGEGRANGVLPAPGGSAGGTPRSARASAPGGADAVADGLEGGVGVVAEGAGGSQADHDDQGQHDGILDRGRAVFLLQELHDGQCEFTHGCFSAKNEPVTKSPYTNKQSLGPRAVSSRRFRWPSRRSGT